MSALCWVGLCPGTSPYTEQWGLLAEDPVHLFVMVKATCRCLEQRPIWGAAGW